MRLIDADWVLNALTVYGQSYDYVSVGRVTEVIEDAPTIEAEPVRRGKWLVTPYTDYDDTYECSECGYGWVFVEGTPKENDANYCPYCGAKMEE